MATANPMKSYRRYKGGRPKHTGRKLLTALLVLILVGVLAFGTLFGIVLAGSHDDVNGNPQVMIILGCQVMPSGAPSVLLRDRLNTALDYLQDHPDMTVIVTGGKGSDEVISEAQAMANYLTPYLTARGFSEERILLEERATSTYENMIYSLEMIKAENLDLSGGVIIVSNGFHLTRARMLWNRVEGGETAASTLAAPCSYIPSRIWMHIREPLVFAKDLLTRR
jgi:uncharacterized SAM-binding protein YcdF (DUF218 family)